MFSFWYFMLALIKFSHYANFVLLVLAYFKLKIYNCVYVCLFLSLILIEVYVYCRTGRPHLDYGGVGKKAIENYLYNTPQARRVFIGKSTK